MASARRTLSDLYVVSVDVDVPDPMYPDDPIKVTLVKLNQPDTDSLFRHCNARKAAVLIDSKNPESDRYREAEAALLEWPDRDVAEWAISDQLAEERLSVQHRVASEDPWGTDGYLDTLVQSWDDEMKVRFEDDPDDEDAAKVKTELVRFGEQVESEFKELADELIEVQESRGRDALMPKAVQKLLEVDGARVWTEESRFQRLFYATRQPGKKGTPPQHWTRYFGTVDEVRALAPQVVDLLLDKYNAMAVETLEGKGSPAEPVSSPLSGPPDDPETVPVSGPSEPID